MISGIHPFSPPVYLLFFHWDILHLCFAKADKFFRVGDIFCRKGRLLHSLRTFTCFHFKSLFSFFLSLEPLDPSMYLWLL